MRNATQWRRPSTCGFMTSDQMTQVNDACQRTTPKGSSNVVPVAAIGTFRLAALHRRTLGAWPGSEDWKLAARARDPHPLSKDCLDRPGGSGWPRPERHPFRRRRGHGDAVLRVFCVLIRALDRKSGAAAVESARARYSQGFVQTSHRRVVRRLLPGSRRARFAPAIPSFDETSLGASCDRTND